MCLNRPHQRTDEQFFYKHVYRNSNGVMQSPTTGTPLTENANKWQKFKRLKCLINRGKIKSSVAYDGSLLGKLFVYRVDHQQQHGENWLVEAGKSSVLCDDSAAALNTFRFLGQVIDPPWVPEERKRRSAAAKKGWATRRAKNEKKES